MRAMDSHPIMIRNVERLRMAKGWSKNRLSQISGVNSGHLSRILNRDVSPSIRALDKLAKALGVEVWELLRDEEEEM